MTLMKLKWNTHYSSIFSLLSSFLNNETMVDITIAAEGQFLKAHRIILCACSQFFQDLISSLDKDKQPVVFLRGVKFAQIQTLIKFIYSGEIQVPSEELADLLAVAEELKIRGILDYHSDETNEPATATDDEGLADNFSQTNHQGDQGKVVPKPMSTSADTPSTSFANNMPISIVPKLTASPVIKKNFSNNTKFRIRSRPSTPTPPESVAMVRQSQSPLPFKRAKIGPKSKIRRQSDSQAVEVRAPLSLVRRHSRQHSTASIDMDMNSANQGQVQQHEPEEMEQYLADAEVKIEPNDRNHDHDQMGDDGSIESMNEFEDEDHGWHHDIGLIGGDEDEERATEPLEPPPTPMQRKAIKASPSNLSLINAGASSSGLQQQAAGSGRGLRTRRLPQQQLQDPLRVTAAAAVRRKRPGPKSKCQPAISSKTKPSKYPKIQYTLSQKRNAVQLLDMGYSCRQVAELMGPGCSSGTPTRWKQQLMGITRHSKGRPPNTTGASSTSFQQHEDDEESELSEEREPSMQSDPDAETTEPY